MTEKHIFKKKYGQNFLTNINLLQMMVNQADLLNKNVVEVGPGKGTLTKVILTQAKKILAYEIDTSLKKFLNFDSSKINIIYDDILKRDLAKDLQNYFPLAEDIVFIGNLPYSITINLLMKLLWLPQVQTFTFMMQKEVGERLLMTTYKKVDSNFLGVWLQSWFFVKKIKLVKKTMFYPSPKVDGIILKFRKKELDKQQKLFLKKYFFNFIKIVFRQKRKTLINNLKHAFPLSKEILISFFYKYEISLNIRAEEMNFLFLQKIASHFYDFFSLHLS